jgi:hypothetical protein
MMESESSKDWFKREIEPYKPKVYSSVKHITHWARQYILAKYDRDNSEFSSTLGANKHKYGTHAQFRDDKNGITYWCKFDRENFTSYGRQFREHKDTVGETINKDIIDYLEDKDFIIIGKPTAIYIVSVKEIKDVGRDRMNDADKGLQTISFPVQILNRLDTLEGSFDALD